VGRAEEREDVLWWNSNDAPYASLAPGLGLNENAVKQAVSRLRKQYRKLLVEEVRMTLDTEDEAAVDEELRHLVGVLRR
jgi:hypothetical protein